MLISSPSNHRIKEIVKLRDGGYRRGTGRFLIDGLREICRAVQCGINIQTVFGTANDLALLEKSVKINVKCVEVLPAALEKISFGDRDSLVALAATPEKTLKQFTVPDRADGQPPLLAVLERMEKPGNIGAVFRSADGAGVNGIILADSLCDLFNPAVIRNSMGTVFQLPAAAAGASQTLAYLKKNGYRIAAARCEASIPYTDYDFRQATAIVLGSEADGLTEQWRGKDITAISLPMLGIADSLNVSNAAAVLFYEAHRQRSTARRIVAPVPLVQGLNALPAAE